MTDRKVFIVDENVGDAQAIQIFFEKHLKCNVFTFFSATECEKYLDAEPDVIVLRHFFYDINDNWRVFLQMVNEKYPNTRVIVIAEENDQATSKEYVLNGAYDSLNKYDVLTQRSISILKNLFKTKSLVEERKLYKNSMVFITSTFALLMATSIMII